jgi:hypothetical protein
MILQLIKLISVSVYACIYLAAQPHAIPQLPRSYVDTSMPVMRGGIHRVPPGGDLQAAIDVAQPGDRILLTPGAEYVGSFHLTKKSAPGWIIITTDGPLPAPGQRATRDWRGKFARLVTRSGMPTFDTPERSAAGYRLIGLEISRRPSELYVYNLVLLGNGATRYEDLPTDVIIDRCLLIGNERTRRGVRLGGIRQAVIDSSIWNFVQAGVDTQAVSGSTGPGPFKIANNYLEATTENIAFGGSNPNVPGVVPSDIEIRGNHIVKPLTWKNQSQLLVKNSIEFKAGRRVLIEGNVFENNWMDGQSGYMVVLTPYLAGITDITFRSNIFRNSPSIANISGSVECSRILFENNLFTQLTMENLRMIQIINGPDDVVFRRNTINTARPATSEDRWTLMMMGIAPTRNLSFYQNVATLGFYGLLNPIGTSWTTHVLPAHTLSDRFESNIFIGTQRAMPAINTFVNTFAEAEALRQSTNVAGANSSTLAQATARAVSGK